MSYFQDSDGLSAQSKDKVKRASNLSRRLSGYVTSIHKMASNTVLPLARQVTVVLKPMRHLWRNYVRFLDKHGWRAQAINTCLLVGLGDVTAQILVKRHVTLDSYDFLCSLRYFGIGLFMLGPTMHVWYTSLDRVFTSHTFRAAVYKMLCDQLLFLPVYVLAIVVVMGVLRLESTQEICAQIRRDYPNIMLASWQLWPAIQIANFHLVPLKHRILVMNLVGLFYNTYVAWKVEQGAAKRQKSEATPIIKTVDN